MVKPRISEPNGLSRAVTPEYQMFRRMAQLELIRNFFSRTGFKTLSWPSKVRSKILNLLPPFAVANRVISPEFPSGIGADIGRDWK